LDFNGFSDKLFAPQSMFEAELAAYSPPIEFAIQDTMPDEKSAMDAASE
jgi:hypothetical protein